MYMICNITSNNHDKNTGNIINEKQQIITVIITTAKNDSNTHDNN